MTCRYLSGGALDRLPAAVARSLTAAVARDLRYLDAVRLALPRLRDPDGEDAAVELRGHRLGVDALRESERTAESPERPLEAELALLLALVLGDALAGYRERTVLDLDLDVLLGARGGPHGG